MKKTYVCQGCQKPLLEETDGFVVKGNLYVADGQGGLIGDSFALRDKKGHPKKVKSIEIDKVQEHPFCTKCFYDVTFGAIRNKPK